MRLASLTSGEATVGGDGELQLVSSMACLFADTLPSTDAADAVSTTLHVAVSTTLHVAFGAVGQSLGHSIELVNAMSTCDEKSSSGSQKGDHRVGGRVSKYASNKQASGMGPREETGR